MTTPAPTPPEPTPTPGSTSPASATPGGAMTAAATAGSASAGGGGPAGARAAGPAVAPAKPRRRRRHWLGRTVLGLVIAVVVLALVAGGLLVWSVRRAFPQLDGAVTLPGLSASVAVYRDSYGIPQVYGASEADLFMAEGYLHAQDRFFEMDFRRHVTSGRLSEMFGASEVGTDAFLRTLGWHDVAQQEWDGLDDETKGYLTAYAAGVNAWLDQHPSNASKSLEYSILDLTNRGYTVAPWDPVDTLAWLKAMAWDLRGNMTDEIDRAVLLASGLTRDQVESLYPDYPYDTNAPITTIGTTGGNNYSPPPAGITDAAPELGALGDAVAQLPQLLGENDSGLGSNSWVIGGQYTTTGKPILANDPHLGTSMPGIWYQIGLHCTACDLNVEGFSFSGVPGIIIGHNDHIAWGFTNLGPDVTDLYLEKIKDNTYFDGTDWQPMTVRTEVINVAGGDPVTITVRSTKHGPLLSDRSQELLTTAARPPLDDSGAPVTAASPAPTPSLDDAAAGVPAAAAQPYGVALEWTALQPGTTIKALFTLDRATDWDSFRAAAAQFDVPAQNLVYADTDGNIGYQAPGKIPVRGNGDGRWPAPGWDPSYDWTGYIPFAKLPSVYNPPQGWIVTANQAATGPGYPYLLTDDWDYGYRSQRIRDMIAEQLASISTKISVETTGQMQFDTKSALAPILIGALRALPVRPAESDILLDWDYYESADSAPAALFNVFWQQLLAQTFDELPADRKPDGNGRWWTVITGLLQQPDNAWWDDAATPPVEDRDQILLASITAAVDQLKKQQGTDPAKWQWGTLHTLTLTNQSFGSSGIAPIEWLFNRGPYPVAGGSSVVDASGSDISTGFDVTESPSMRMIVDLSNLDNSRWIELTGNSGHAFAPNYADQFPLWQAGKNISMPWNRESIMATAAHTLTLTP